MIGKQFLMTAVFMGLVRHDVVHIVYGFNWHGQVKNQQY